MICRVRRRVGSRSWRARLRRIFAIWTRVSGGQMAARSAWARTQTWRQIEGARVGLSSGGRAGHFGRGIVDQQGEQEMRHYPGFGEVWVFGRQAVEMQDRFQAFEGELDLPADT